MKLANYLIESDIVKVVDGSKENADQGQKIIDLVNKDCQFYMKLNPNFKTNPLYRGIKGSSLDILDMGMKATRTDRRPKGMDSLVFKVFNKWLSDNGHLIRSNSVSVSSDKKSAGMFGNAYVIFPIGKFDYTWVKSKDINISDIRTGWKDFNIEDALWDDIKGRKGEYDREEAKKLSGYFKTNNGIDEAITNGYEIWMNPKQYYIMTEKTFKGVFI